MKYTFVLLALLFFTCDSKSEDDLFITGTVSHITSCGGLSEPVYIIKLSDVDSIMTSNLPDTFQITNLKIQFKTKAPSSFVYCTTDKVYPEQFDVYNVETVLEP